MSRLLPAPRKPPCPAPPPARLSLLPAQPTSLKPLPRYLPEQARIGAFRRWLQERPESCVVAVGHSSYWRAFEEVCRGAQPERMRNCEFRLIHF